jgi:hypothetical protein
LLPFRSRLDALKEILQNDSEAGKHAEPIVRLMKKKLMGVGTSLPSRGVVLLRTVL